MSYLSNNFTPIHTREEYLKALADATSPTEAEMRKIVERASSVGNFLDREGSSIKHLNPHVSSQGSVRLGTVNRPLNATDELDVDLVCKLQYASKAVYTQLQIKSLVSSEIKLYAKSHGMNPPHEGRRCVTLNYRDEIGFHLDVLPAIPDADGMRSVLRKQQLTNDMREHLLGSVSDKSIAITCREHEHYYRVSSDWPVSNPDGYADWFAARQKTVLHERRLLKFNDKIHASVDDIPMYEVKTPLQDAIKILKWDRDVTLGNEDDKPISIIITTLAAHAYRGEATLTEALKTILTQMEEFIERRAGICWIANPTNPSENFADRWEKSPSKEKMFFKWLRTAQRTYLNFLRQPLSKSSSELLQNSVKLNIVDKLNERLQPSTPPNPIASPAVISRQVQRTRQVRRPEKPWAR